MTRLLGNSTGTRRMETVTDVKHVGLWAAFFAALMNGNVADAANTYSAVHGFSIKANPSGVWSYLDSNLLQYKSRGFNGVKRLNYYWNNTPYPDTVLVLKNASGQPATTNGGFVVVPTDHLLLDGQASPSGAVVRFTAPTAGAYDIRGDFEGLNMAEQSHRVAILLDGNVVFSRTVAGYDNPVKFNLRRTLSGGDTLDFVSLPKGDGAFEGTGLSAKVVAP